MSTEALRFRSLFEGLAAIGRGAGGQGWTRLAWTREDAAARTWFVREAEAIGLEVEVDRNGNLWAWWRPDRAASEAVATGSHLDTVPAGGAFDGALGVVSGLLAVERLKREGARPLRPLAVVAFADEEGGRFGTPTFGSRLLTGALDPAAVLDRGDGHGVRVADALASAGVDPNGLGAEHERVAGLAAFVELHVEQGRGLDPHGVAVGLASGIWPHGRWRLTLTGEGNHAGTTRIADRHDPMVVAAEAIVAARIRAIAAGGVATVGRVLVEPNGINSIPARMQVWLDARAPEEGGLDELLRGWQADSARAAASAGVEADVVEESRTPAVEFDADLTKRLSDVVAGAGPVPPVLPTAAGHDAGILAASVPTTMLFVRNPTGVSHSPAEHADEADCLAGVGALTRALEDLACR